MQLTGPGRIWLQTMTVPNLAHALEPYLQRPSADPGTSSTNQTGVAGQVLKGLFGNNT